MSHIGDGWVNNSLTTASFVSELFQNETGYVYAPLKNNYWVQRFFKWPDDKDQLLSHIENCKEHEVYLSPILFSEPRVHPSTFKGTYYLYSEFDGNAPIAPKIPPSIKIQSSSAGYEHWYWRLNEFATGAEEVQEYSKRLAYDLEADLSVWDYAVVLRPPGTYNHKRKRPVKLLEQNPVTYNISTFDTLPRPPDKISIYIDKSGLQPLNKLVAKYQWNDDAYDLLTKPLDTLGSVTGYRDRSAALCRLAIHCANMGMSNDEIFVVLLDADERWQKFIGRTDRERRLEGIISYARTKQAERADFVDDIAVYRFQDFMETNIRLKWIIRDLLPVAGSAVIFGPSGVGKSTFVLRMGIAIATGAPDFLGWPIERQQKVLFTSLEMPHDELKYFISQMNLSDEELAALQENFFIWPIGHPYPFDTRDQQIEILKYIDRFGIELNIIDSLGEATYGSINSQDDMKRLYSFLNEDLRRDRGCGYFFVHHPRKPGGGEHKLPQDFNDAFGDSYIINRAQTVIGIYSPRPRRVKISIFKSRLSQDQQNFHITRNNDRSFTREEEKKVESVVQEAPNILGIGRNARLR